MKLKFPIIFAGCFFIQHYCFAQSTEALRYIKDNAIVIDTNSNNNDLNDLSYLKSAFEGKRIIGMGEATHGTEQFQTTKFRMLKYLVTQMGYKLFGIEADFPECRRVNDYVLYGKGDAKKVVYGMESWPWNTTEVLKMVQWMRTYNATKPEDQKVKFYGFDMQFDKYPIELITAKLKKLDSNYFNANFGQLHDLHIWGNGAYTRFASDKLDSIKDFLNRLTMYVNAQETNLLKIYSKDEVEYTKRDIRLLEQALDEGNESSKGRMSNSVAVRNKYMAENIIWILAHEGHESKIMIWAHNAHIGKGRMGFRLMGSYLKEKYKDQYYAIGFDFNKGSFRAVDVKTMSVPTFTVPQAKESSSSYLLSTLGIPEFFIDIEKSVKINSVAKSFFIQTSGQRFIDATFDIKRGNERYINDALYNEYDGLIFVKRNNANQICLFKIS